MCGVWCVVCGVWYKSYFGSSSGSVCARACGCGCVCVCVGRCVNTHRTVRVHTHTHTHGSVNKIHPVKMTNSKQYSSAALDWAQTSSETFESIVAPGVKNLLKALRLEQGSCLTTAVAAPAIEVV